MEIDHYQHPNFIWTWKTSSGRGRASLWLPYFKKVEPAAPKRKGVHVFSYKGGEVACDLKKLDLIMLYGPSGDLPVSFLDELNTHNISLLIHRRNSKKPYVFFPFPGNDDKDVLTAQIVTRNNMIRRVYVAKTFIQKRLENFSPLVEVERSTFAKLRKARSLEEVRSIEAGVSKKYWKRWFKALGLDGARRRDKSLEVVKALDACSFFLFGILLRWTIFHKLSPSHAFLHVPTNYPSLPYDLMEPYRVWIEDAVAQAAKKCGTESDQILPVSIELLKQALGEKVYVPATRQDVYQKNLLHGVVLALRAYLLGEAPRLVIPVPGDKKGGRPPKTGYRLPG